MPIFQRALCSSVSSTRIINSNLGRIGFYSYLAYDLLILSIVIVILALLRVKIKDIVFIGYFYIGYHYFFYILNDSEYILLVLLFSCTIYFYPYESDMFSQDVFL